MAIAAHMANVRKRGSVTPRNSTVRKWRVNGSLITYVPNVPEHAEIVRELGKDQAMAVYFTREGKVFAWQWRSPDPQG